MSFEYFAFLSFLFVLLVVIMGTTGFDKVKPHIFVICFVSSVILWFAVVIFLARALDNRSAPFEITDTKYSLTYLSDDMSKASYINEDHEVVTIEPDKVYLISEGKSYLIKSDAKFSIIENASYYVYILDTEKEQE